MSVLSMLKEILLRDLLRMVSHILSYLLPGDLVTYSSMARIAQETSWYGYNSGRIHRAGTTACL